MIKTLLPITIIVLSAVVLLSVGVVVKGRFVNSHVSGNRALRRKGIHCAQQQDREARKHNSNAVEERSNRNDK